MTSTIKVNNIQNQCGQNIINENSNTITIGASGDTISLASGASQTGFGREGSVDWQTGSIKTTTFTAASGEGYFVDTSSGAVTANLPAGTAGAIVAFADYTRTFNNNNLTIVPNGSNKIGGIADDLVLSTKGQALTLVFVDSTEGWINVQNSDDTETGTPPFIQATGGTITSTPTCTIHTFTGPGSFIVSKLSPTPANNALAYLVVAGGGAGGGSDNGTSGGAGGGGAGGFREGRNNPITPYTASPLAAACSALTATVATFPIVVGAGGTGIQGAIGNNGVPSSFSTVTSTAGGGGGARHPSPPSSGNGSPGGSGGGGGYGASSSGSQGNGNTPSVSPPQGNPGASYSPGSGGSRPGGGGGATASGAVSGSSDTGGAGGAGATTSINNSATAYAGGGGGGAISSGSGGNGGGGNGNVTAGVAGQDNTGGGGGGSAGCGSPTDTAGGNGGSGVVIIRYKSA